MNVAIHRATASAQKSKQSERDINVHEELAPFFIRADGQIPEQAERQAKPCGNQRRLMDPAGAKKSRKPENTQQESENQCYFCHAKPPYGCMARISVVRTQFPTGRPLTQ